MLPRMTISIFVCSIAAGCGGSPPGPSPSTVVLPVAEKSLPPMEDEAPEAQEAERAKNGKGKIAECNALIEIINKGINELNSSSSRGAGTNTTATADHETMADTMDRVAEDLSNLETRDQRLKELSGEYQSMAREVTKSARDLVAAFEAGDAVKVNAAKAAIEQAVKRESPLVDAINKYCHER